MSFATKQHRYAYDIFLDSGQRIREHIQADSLQHAKALLNKQAIYPIRIKRVSAFFHGTKKLSKQQLLHLTLHLQQAIQAHLALPQVLTLLQKKEKNTVCQKIVKHLLKTVEQGNPLSVAMQALSEHFPDDYQACIRAGEAHGDLAQALAQAHRNLQAQCDLIKTIKKALTYPIIIMILATAILAAMMLFVIPQFSTMYQQLGSTLPLPTQILIQITQLSLKIAPAFLFGLLLITGALKIALSRLPHVNDTWQKSCLKLPWLGHIIRQRFSIQWMRIVGTLMQSGIHLTHAMAQGHQATTYAYFKNQLRLCNLHIEQGMLLSKSLAQIDFIHDHSLMYIEMGEQNGQLGAALTQQAEQQHHDLSERLTQLTRLLEPLIMVILAVVLGSILIVLYLPLFNLGRLF